jgi:hypothetical protein
VLQYSYAREKANWGQMKAFAINQRVLGPHGPMSVQHKVVAFFFFVGILFVSAGLYEDWVARIEGVDGDFEDTLQLPRATDRLTDASPSLQTPLMERASSYTRTTTKKEAELRSVPSETPLPPTLTLVGDSVMRGTFYALQDIVNKVDPTRRLSEDEAEARFLIRHDSQSVVLGNGWTVQFEWAPFVGDAEQWLQVHEAPAGPQEFVVMGLGLWDLLYRFETLEGYTQSLTGLLEQLERWQCSEEGVYAGRVAWRDSPPLVDAELDGHREAAVQFREAYVQALNTAMHIKYTELTGCGSGDMRGKPQQKNLGLLAVHAQLSDIDPRDYTDGVHSLKQAAALAESVLYYLDIVPK